MKKLSLLSFFAISFILLSGCGNSPIPLVEQETTTGEIIEESINTWVLIQNTLNKDALQAIDKKFWTGLTLSNTHQLGDYFITNADDNSQEVWSSTIIVMGKMDNNWVSLYEGNSGEISCTIVTEFWFPQEVLYAYGTECLQWADYTIPEKTKELIQTSNITTGEAS